MMVDPAFVTLGSVPFLLIRGLPRAAALQACFIHSDTKYFQKAENNFGSPVSYYTTNNNLTNVALSEGIGPGVQCLMALPYRLPTNITLLDAEGNIPLVTQIFIQHSLVSMSIYTLFIVYVQV